MTTWVSLFKVVLWRGAPKLVGWLLRLSGSLRAFNLVSYYNRYFFFFLFPISCNFFFSVKHFFVCICAFLSSCSECVTLLYWKRRFCEIFFCERSSHLMKRLSYKNQNKRKDWRGFKPLTKWWAALNIVLPLHFFKSTDSLSNVLHLWITKVENIGDSLPSRSSNISTLSNKFKGWKRKCH